MVELKLKFKTKKYRELKQETVSKEVKQELKKSDPINLIDVYFALTQRIFKCKNIRIRNNKNNITS